MPETIRMTFNGREVETEAGKPLIELSRELGDEIPHFCYHPGIGVDGNCRMCLVEMKGVPKLVAGCTLSAAADMEIVTNSKKVRGAREGVLEFILVNHPLDCPICDKGGECPLQDYTRLHGPAHSRMGDDKNLSFKHRAIGEHIVFDDERCIRCSRCVRFQRDVAGREELGFRQRGDHISIDLFENRPLTSGFTGNLADICPVGALTTREFRFRARPWEMRRVATACGGCSLHCAAFAWWKEDEILRLTADVDHRINDWWLCDRGRFAYPVEDAVAGSLVRRQGEQVPVSFAEAATRARELLSASDRQAAVLVGSRATNEEIAHAAALQPRLGSELSPFAVAAEELEFFVAQSTSTDALADLATLGEFDRVLVLGTDPELTHPLFALRLGQATEKSAMKVTLVEDGDFAPRGDFTRRWELVQSDPAAWLAGSGQDYLAGAGRLLVVFHEHLVRAGAVDAATLAAWSARTGGTKILPLYAGMNRRGLLAEASRYAGGASLLAALEAGEVGTLLLFGVDPEVDFADGEHWQSALRCAARLIVQSPRLESLHASAEVLLSRRRAVDLAGHVINSFGLERTLTSWAPVAGERAGDTDWFEPLLSVEPSPSLEVAGSHEG